MRDDGIPLLITYYQPLTALLIWIIISNIAGLVPVQGTFARVPWSIIMRRRWHFRYELT
jgi:hypothetical protein